jgi:ADP-ribose pyrophosphatase YjhB (NUDIX family)
MGSGYSPLRLPIAETNKDSHLSDEFKKRWADIDKSNQDADEILSSQNPKFENFKGTELTFNWQNENSRFSYIKKVDKNKLEPNFIKKPTGANFVPTFQKTKELYSSGLLEKIGIYANKPEGHPFFVTFHGDKLVKFSSTPSDANADANSIKQILGAIHPELNPETFETIYQSWIRNPYITIADENGKNIGVRLGLANNDTKMRNELRKRVRDVYDFVSRSTGGKIPKAQYPLEKENSDATTAEFPSTAKALANDFIRRIQPSLLNRAHSVDSLSKLFNQNAEEMAMPELPSREQMQKYLQDNFPEVLQNLKPESSPLDGVTDDEVAEAVEVVSMLNDGTRVLKFGEIKKLLSTKENGYELWTDDAVDEVINTVNRYTEVAGGSQLIDTSAAGKMSSSPENQSQILRDEFEAARTLRSIQRAQDMTPEQENEFRKIQWMRQQLEEIVEEDWVRFGPFVLTNSYRGIAEKQSGNMSFHLRTLGDKTVKAMFDEISSKFPNAENKEAVKNFESQIRTALSKAARGDELTPKYPESWPPELIESDLNEILSPKEMAAVAKVEDSLDRETLLSMLGGEIGEKDETRKEILRIVGSLPKVSVPASKGSRELISTPEQMGQNILIEAFDGTPKSVQDLVNSFSEQQLDAFRKSIQISSYTKDSFDNQNLQIQRASLIRQTSIAVAKLSQTEEGRNKIRQQLSAFANELPDGSDELLKKIQNSEILEEDVYESLSRYIPDSSSTQPISGLWFTLAAPLFSANNETSSSLKVSETSKKNQVDRLFAEIALVEEPAEKIKTQLQDFVALNPVDGIGARTVITEATLAGTTQSALEKKQLELISKYDGTSESAKEIIDSLTDEQIKKLWAGYIWPTIYKVSGTGPGSLIRKKSQKIAAERTQQILNRLGEKFKKSVYGLGGFVDADGYSADDVNMLISEAIDASFGTNMLENLTTEDRSEYVSLVDYFLSGGRSLLGKGEYSEAVRKINLDKTPSAIKRRKIQQIDEEIAQITDGAGDRMDDAVRDLLDQYRKMSPEEIEARRLEEEAFEAERRRTRPGKYQVGGGDDYEPAPEDWEDDGESTSAVGSMAKAPNTLNEKARALLDAALNPHRKHDEEARLEFNNLHGNVYDELALQGVDIPLGFSYDKAEDVYIDPEIEKIYVRALNFYAIENYDDSEFRRLKNGTLLYVPQRLIGGESSSTEQTATTEEEYAPYNPEMDEDESLRPSNFNPENNAVANALENRYNSFIGGNNNYFTRDWFHENGRYGTEAEKLLQSINNEPGLIDMDKVLIYVQNQSGWIEGEDLEQSIIAAKSISLPVVPDRYRSGGDGSRFGMSSFASARRLSSSEKLELDRQKKIARSKAKSSKALRDGWLNDMTTGSMLDESEIGLRDGYYPDAVISGIKTALRENGQIDNFDSVIRAARNAATTRSQSESRVKALARVIEITQNSGDLISEIYNIDNAINEIEESEERTSRQYQERIRAQILSRVSATASIIKARDMFIAGQKEKISSGTISPRDYLISIQQWDAEYGPQILQMQAEIQSFSTKAEASSRARQDLFEQRDELLRRAEELKALVADSAQYMGVLLAQKAINDSMKNLANNGGDGVIGSGPAGNMRRIGYTFGESGAINGFDDYLRNNSNMYTPFNIPMTKKEKALSNVMLSQLRSVNGIQTVDLIENRDSSSRQRIEAFTQRAQTSPVGAVRTLSNQTQDMPSTIKNVLQNEYNRSVGQMLASEKDNDIRSLINASYSSSGMPSRTSQILEEMDKGTDIYSLARKNNIPITEIFSIAAIRESLLASVKYDIQKLTLNQVADKYGFDKTRLSNAAESFKRAEKFRKSYAQMQNRFNDLIKNNTLAESYALLNEEFPEMTKVRGMGSAGKLIAINDELMEEVKTKIARAMRLFDDYPNMSARVASALTGIHQDSAKSIYMAVMNDGNRPPRSNRNAKQVYSALPGDWDYMTYGERQDWLSSDEAKERMGEQARTFALQRNAEDIESSGSMDGPYGAMASALKKANLDKNIYGTNSTDENGVSPIFAWKGIKDSDLIRTGFLSTSKFVESFPNLQNVSDENLAVFLNTSPAIAKKLRSGKFNLSLNAARKLSHSIGKNPEKIWPAYTASEQEVGPDGDILWIAGNWTEMKPVFESIESGQNDSEISNELGRLITPKMATARKLAENGKLEEFYNQVGKKNPSVDEAAKFMSSNLPESRRDTVASFARAGYTESEIVDTTGFNPNTVRNILHELRKSGIAPTSVGSQEWVAKNRKSILEDIASGMSKRQAMRKYGIGAAALNSIIQPSGESSEPRQSFRNAYEAMSSGPVGAMASRRISEDASQANGPTPEWDSDSPEVRVFLPETPPVVVGNPFYGPYEARRFSDGAQKDQEALARWFSGLGDLLKYHISGGQLYEATIGPDEDSPSVFPELENSKTKKVNEMINEGQFPGLIRSMRHIMRESYNQMLVEQEIAEDFGQNSYSESEDDAIEFESGFIDAESIMSIDSPIAKDILAVYRALGRSTSGFVKGDSKWINDVVRLMSRDSELERIGLNEDSKNRINDWMRRATSREFKAAQAMSSIHSMMIDAVNDINRAMYPISQFTDRTVADDQMLAWYLDRIFKAIYDESSVSSFVLEDMSREKGADFVQLNPEQTERWYDSVKDLSDTMAALFADAIEFSSVNSKISDDSFDMLSVAPRKAADGRFSIYGPDIVYSGFEDSRPYNKNVKWFAQPGAEQQVESLYEMYEKSPDVYWWQDSSGNISTDEPITTKDILSMDSGEEFSRYIKILTESLSASPDEDAANVLRKLFGVTLSDGVSLNKEELALAKAYSQLNGFLRSEVDALKENKTRVSENMTMSSYFPWVNWSNSSDAYPVISGDIQSMLTPKQAERFDKINSFTEEKVNSLNDDARATYARYLESQKNTTAINNLRRTQGTFSEVMRPIDRVNEEIAKLRENREYSIKAIEILGALNGFAQEIGAEEIANDIDILTMKVINALDTNDKNAAFTTIRDFASSVISDKFGEYLNFFDSAISVGDAFEKVAQFIKAEDKKTRRNSLMSRYKREVIDSIPESVLSSSRKSKNVKTFDSWLNENGYEDLTYEFYSSADDIPKNFFSESSPNEDNRIVPPGDGPVGKMALNRYTKPNILSVVHAHEEAKLGNSSEVTIPHLLLGLARENIGKKSVNQSIAGRVLARLGINVNELRDAINNTVAKNTDENSDKVIALSFGARKTMINSVKEALNRGENIIDTEHLIASIAKTDDGRDDGLSSILESLGTNKSELLAESISTMKRFSMGSFPNERGPVGKMGVAREQILQKDREIEALRAEVNSSNLWFNRDRNPGIRNNTASDAEQVNELKRLLDLYVSGLADKSIPAYDFREGISPFSADAIMPTNSSIIYGEIGEEPSDIIGAIAYRSNFIEAMVDRAGKNYKEYTDTIAKAKSIFNNNQHIELFDEDSPAGRMSTFDGLIKSFEGIYGMPEMQPQDEYYEKVYGPRDIASDSIRRAAYVQSNYSPLDLSNNLTSGDDADIEWSTNNWSLAKDKFMEASDAVIVRMQNNDLRSAEVLMIDRKSGPFTNSKALVGGLRDGSEDYMTTATREGLEEVGIDLDSSIDSRPLGIISSPDWDPRFVKGSRIGAGLFIVPWDSNVTAASDAKAANWVSLEEIARGKYPLAFGHAEWLRRAVAKMGKDYEGSNSADPFSDLRMSMAMRLNLLAKAQRLRNQRIIARINKVRAEKNAEQFLPNDKMPHPMMPWGAEFKSDSWSPDGPVGRSAGPSRPVVDKSLAQDLNLLDYQSGYSIDELSSPSPVSTSQKYRLNGNRVSDDRYNGLWVPYIENSIARVAKPELRDDTEQPTVFVLGGSSGTGKTVARSTNFSGIPSYQDAVVVDPDDAKMIMPEARYWFEKRLPDAANLTHSESRAIAASLMRRAASEGVDITYDTSGQFNDGNRDLIDWKNSGYKIVAHYFFSPDDVIAQRNKERFERTGRMVPDWIPPAINRNLYFQLPSLDPFFDELFIYDTTGDPMNPVMIARRAINEQLEIMDPKLFDFANFNKN